ncbi:MAG TPA: hypothetical protein IAC22_01250 [Candidatus Caccocola faecipullorum]|nr:hypothetical protein [Candidatus Caccocola faecipullorum]
MVTPPRKSVLVHLLILIFFTAAFAANLSSPAFAEGGNLVKDTDGYYLIDDEYDLEKFREGVNGDAVDVHGNQIENNANARLTGDIDLSSYNWTPIGNGTTQYTGTFDGCGYSITGLTIDSTEQYVGLFGYIGADGTVKNLTVSASEDGIKANYSPNFGYAGAVAGQSDGTITNCTFASGSVTGSGNYACVGGIVGNFSNGTISNCTNNGKVVGNNDNGRSGGIC